MHHLRLEENILGLEVFYLLTGTQDFPLHRFLAVAIGNVDQEQEGAIQNEGYVARHIFPLPMPHTGSRFG